MSRASISEVCDSLGLTPRAVRFYESRGLIHAERGVNNYRVFDRTTQNRLALIKQLREGGLSINDIRRVIGLEAQGAAAQHRCALDLLRKRDTELDIARRRVAATIAELEEESQALAVAGGRGA